MKYLKRTIYICFLVLLCACENNADLKNTKDYAKDGLTFTMPGNWNVTEDSDAEGYRYLIVETPGDAILTVNIFPKDESSLHLKEYVDWFIEETINNFPIGSRDEGIMTKISYSDGDKQFNGFKNEFTVSLVGVDIPHIAMFSTKESNLKIAYIHSQVAVEDLAKTEQGFELIQSSFMLENGISKGEASAH